ncbi:protein PIP82 isoform X2 [Drosophila sulfurigaster albostrigata]|uniref:protein PIP82 isoform X2 n=1 Tax=Drosophila sulfurigaster albostrigata TaxID=89887 RepID=UPI002D21E5C4|nr:protein PIP82 isoform X2 [Drosophila sulfurigaster albostrigata]
MSHHLSQESSQQPQQPERGRHGGGGGGGGIMDLRNLCQRIDVDSLKAKLPAMPQLKFPKTLPKLRGARRIFRSSRDNVNKAASHEGATVGGEGGGVSSGQLALPQQQQQAAQFINRTPQRISTISSLMHEQTSTEQQQQQHHHHHLQPSGATYCSAGSLDDDYYAPYGGSMTARVSRPISPIKMPPTSGDQQQQQERGTLTQRLQRGYKSLSELRLKHLFAKQTVVRRDNIEVQRYVEQYEAERRVEQMAQARRDRDIADNYDIHISTLPITRQNTLKQQQQDGEEADEDAVQQVRRMADHSGDESGLETPPPPPPPAVARKKKPGGIAATRFAKVRQPPLQMPVEEGAMDQQQQQPSQEKQPMRQAVRQKLKRLRKSMKRRQASQQQQDSDDEEEEQEKQQQQQRGSTASNLRARLRRFASSEQLQQRWRKSFKGGDEEGTDTGTGKGGAGIGGAGKGGAGLGGASFGGAGLGGAGLRGAGMGGAGMGGAGLGGAGLGGAGLGGGATAAGSGLGVAAQLERSLARLNEKLQQLKFFQRKSQQPQGNKPNTVGREPIEIDDEELPATYHHSDSDSEHGSNDSDDSGQDICAEDAFGQLDIGIADDAPRSASPMLVKHQTLATLAQLQAHASTAWSSESLEEDIALDGQQQQQRDEMACTAADYPRVLIHQQHSDAYESTLIIAVTTTPPTPSPPHSQQHQQQPWLPNEQIIAGFKEQQQRDCWPAPMLYKPKSIDIFESGDGGAASAFADFDEALRNAPVLRISAGSSCDSNTEDADDNSSRVTRIRVQTPRIGNSRESLMEQQTLEQEEEQEEEAEEALEELEEGQEQPEEQLDLERAEEESERPPSMSPPPPPLPQRRPPPPTSAAPIYDAVPPPLPISKPPTTLATATAPPPLTAATTTTVATAAPTTPPVAAAPPTPVSPVAAAPPLQRQPLRSASMTRPAKPLVKTSSLRLTYNEQMHPNDVGKVNKLISRFGGRSRLGARRLHSEELTICSDGDDESEELPEEPATPTPANVKRSTSSNNNNNNVIPDIVTTAASSNNNNNETIQLDRQNSNCSRSEYGSPLAYPQLNSTPTATTTTTVTSARAGRPRAPQPQSQPQLQLQSQSQLQLQRRSRRSMTRDDDNFYSFDSDEAIIP